MSTWSKERALCATLLIVVVRLTRFGRSNNLRDKFMCLLIGIIAQLFQTVRLTLFSVLAPDPALAGTVDEG